MKLMTFIRTMHLLRHASLRWLFSVLVLLLLGSSMAVQAQQSSVWPQQRCASLASKKAAHCVEVKACCAESDMRCNSPLCTDICQLAAPWAMLNVPATAWWHFVAVKVGTLPPAIAEVILVPLDKPPRLHTDWA